MPFWRTRLSAKRFIAGVGGYAAAPLPTAAPSKGAPPIAEPSLSLPMMRWATSHTASIAPTISCLPTTTSSSRHSSCAVTPGSTRTGSACLRTPNSDKPVSVGTMCFPWAIKKLCFLSPPMISARVAGVPMALGFLQALPQHLIVNEPPSTLHRLDQGAFVVTRRWPCLLVLDFWILQSRSLTVAQRWKQLCLLTLFVRRLPLRECCAPAEIDGLTAGGAEFEATHVERCGGLPIAEIGHQGCQIGPRDNVEQLLLVG